jgi:acetyl esterase
MPLDPQCKALMDQMAKSGMPRLETLGPAEARRVTSEMFQVLRGTPEPVANVENRRIRGPAGEIPVRIYTPEGAGPFPMLVYYHGGGWVIGDLESHDAACRALTNGARCVTVAVDYRLAPEHKFPAAVDDCYAATLWASENASSLNADARRLAVGGDSAGGNLAAVVSLVARDKGTPPIAFQLLVYPATDGALNTWSHKNFLDYFLTHEAVVYFWNHYVRTEADKRNPLASPALASNLKGLAPALVITAEFDPLRDEGEAYGRRLREAGVPVTVTRYDGMIHGFFTMGDALAAGKRAMAEACEALRRAFGS